MHTQSQTEHILYPSKDVPKNYAICRWHALQAPFSTTILAGRKTELLLLPFKAWAFIIYGIAIARLATFLFEKNLPKVNELCLWHALSDAISDENFDRTKN